MTVVVKVENVSKKYQLGNVGTQSLKGDMQRWWHKMRGKEDPFAKIDDESQHRNGEFWALQDINFEVRQGEAVGIIGKNGAGKSTLLKILSRITNPTTGSVKVKGRIASLLEVGTGFNPDLTGRENIYLNGAILGMSKREISAKFDEIVDFSGVEKFINTPVKRYSSGMYVRLAFAVAAHLESEILILDEVLAVGDIEFQRKCLEKMDDVIHNQGKSILFVSHSMGAIKDLCSGAIYLKKGQVFMQGDTESIIKYYVEENMVKNFSAELSLDDPTHRRGFGHARYSDIKLFNAKGIETNHFLSGEKIIFRLKGVIKDKIEELYALIALRAGKGREIITNTKREKVFLQGLQIGDEFLIDFKLSSYNLRPGAYDLYFWLGSSNNENPYDVVDSLTKPLIIDIPEGQNPIFSGYFNIDYKFEQYINDRVKQ